MDLGRLLRIPAIMQRASLHVFHRFPQPALSVRVSLQKLNDDERHSLPEVKESLHEWHLHSGLSGRYSLLLLLRRPPPVCKVRSVLPVIRLSLWLLQTTSTV